MKKQKHPRPAKGMLFVESNVKGTPGVGGLADQSARALYEDAVGRSVVKTLLKLYKTMDAARTVRDEIAGEMNICSCTLKGDAMCEHCSILDAWYALLDQGQAG